MDFSLVIPCYNEAQNLTPLFDALTSCFDDTPLTYELIFVNDGSTDDTKKILNRVITSYCENPAPSASCTVIEFSRNFGKEAALYAGLERAKGNYLCFIDADMQQDPVQAKNMLSFLREHPEYDCVAAVQEKRDERLFLRVCKKVFYRVFNGMGETTILTNASDFRVFTREVATALLSMHEHFRFTKGLFAWIGFKTYPMPYSANKRFSGKSKWTRRHLFSYAWNGILAFSTWPLRLIMYCGLITAFLSIVFLGIDAYEKLAFGSDIPGYQMVLYVSLLLGGIQMFVMGVFGEYMARTYIESKRRPLYVIRDSFTTEDETPCK